VTSYRIEINISWRAIRLAAAIVVAGLLIWRVL
jgi:hypothetical protein